MTPELQKTVSQDSPLVSIVVSNYNGLRFGVLEKCLLSIFQITYSNYELLVIDNCSDDGSARYLKERFETRPLKVVRNPANNYTQGLNLALDAAGGKFLLYLNNDVEVNPGFVEPLVESMEARKEVGIVQCKLLDARNRSRIDSLGEEIDFLGYHTSWSAGELDFGSLAQPFEVPCTNGSAFMIRKHVLSELGGFDARYHSGYEDVNLSLAARALGYTILTNPRSVVYHARGTTALSDQMRVVTTYHFAKNRLVTLLKFHRIYHLLLVLPMLAVAYFLESLWVTGKEHRVDRGAAKLRALFWVWGNLDYVIKERKKVHREARR